MTPLANARFYKISIPLFNYIMEYMLMATGIAEHIHSTRSLPKVLLVDSGSLSLLIQKPGCHVPQSLLHGARLIRKAFRCCGMAEAAV